MPATQESSARGPRAPQAASVLEALLGCASWDPFKGPTGVVLWRMPGADGALYTVSRVSCTCPAEQYAHGQPCKHIVALTTYLIVAGDARRRRAPAPPKETTDGVA